MEARRRFVGCEDRLGIGRLEERAARVPGLFKIHVDRPALPQERLDGDDHCQAFLKLLMAEDISPETLHGQDQAKIIPPLAGALLKNEQAVHLFERLVFMSRRAR